MVEESLAGAQEDVVDAGLYLLYKRAVASHADLLIRTVVAHHINQSGRQFVAVFLINPTLHGLYHLCFLKRVDMVPSARIATIAGEVAAVVQSFEGHAEVVAGRIEGEARMLQLFEVGGVFQNKDIQSAHAGMSVA